jgi:hypothetical protein
VVSLVKVQRVAYDCIRCGPSERVAQAERGALHGLRAVLCLRITEPAITRQ